LRLANCGGFADGHGLSFACHPVLFSIELVRENCEDLEKWEKSLLHCRFGML
jgi:hypothetical protein